MIRGSHRHNFVTWHYGLLLTLFSAVSATAFGQTVVGRSNTGALPTPVADTVDVASLAKVKALSFAIQFSGPGTENTLNAKESGQLRVTITNNSSVPVRNVVAKLVPIDLPVGVKYNDSVKVGDIPGKGTGYAMFNFTTTEDVPRQYLTFGVEVHQQAGQEPDPQLLNFQTRARRVAGQGPTR